MRSGSALALDPLRFEDSGRLLIAGLAERYNREDGNAAIPRQWQRFATYIGRITGQVGEVAYGISCDTDEQGKVDYLCGVEVSDFSSVPRNFSLLCLPAQRHIVFFHRDHISSIRDTWTAIRSKWLPDSGLEAADALPFERYGESFDPRTGNGGVEIWIPVITPVPAYRASLLCDVAAI